MIMILLATADTLEINSLLVAVLAISALIVGGDRLVSLINGLRELFRKPPPANPVTREEFQSMKQDVHDIEEKQEKNYYLLDGKIDRLTESVVAKLDRLGESLNGRFDQFTVNVYDKLMTKPQAQRRSSTRSSS